MNTAALYSLSTVSGILVIGSIGYAVYFGPYIEARHQCEEEIKFVEAKWSTETDSAIPAHYGFEGKRFATRGAAYKHCLDEKDRLIKKNMF